MAEQSFLQRGLTGFRQTVRTAGRQIGETARNAAKQPKAGIGIIKKKFGFSMVDAMDDPEGQRRRRKARAFLGDDDPAHMGVRMNDPRRDLATVSPEYRAQVSAGLASANSMTTGSTLVDGGGSGGPKA